MILISGNGITTHCLGIKRTEVKGKRRLIETVIGQLAEN
jgi:hypothetical protein